MIDVKRQRLRTQHYDLHGLLGLCVRSASSRVLRYFDAEIGRFRSAETSAAAIEIVVAPFEVAPRASMRIADGIFALDELVYGVDRHKVARWRWAIHGLTQPTTTIYFWGGPFSLGFLQHRFVDQLIRWKLVQRGATLVHGCCLAAQGRSLLMPALMHTGKTNIALHLVRRGWQFQSDDYTIVSATGETLSYPRRLHFSSHVKEQYPDALATISARRRQSMALKQAIYLLTLRYGSLSEALAIQELAPDVEIAERARVQEVILLGTHTGAELCGPTPIRAERAAERVLAVNRREGSHFWDVLLDYVCMNAGLELGSWLQREQRVVEDALRRADCYELLLPQRVADFAALLSRIGDHVARDGMPRGSVAVDPQPVGSSFA